MNLLRKIKIGTRLYATFAVILTVYVLVVLSGILGRIDTIYEIENRAAGYLDSMNVAAVEHLLAGIASDMRASNMVIGVASAFMFILVVLALIVIVRSVVVPVNKLSLLVSDVREGNLNINTEKHRHKDEIEYLTQDVYALVDTIKGIDADMSRYASDYVEKGDVEYRIDENKYKGDYLRLVKGINNFADSNIDDIDILLGVMRSINSGDFNIKVKQMPGKKIVLNEAVDEFVENLTGVVKQINTAVSCSADGITPELSPDKFLGGWNTVVKGLEDIFANLDAPISEIMESMDELSQGHFNKKITGSYRGDFLELKNSVNTTIEVLNGYIEDISNILKNIAAGDLTARIEREYIGDFATIRDSINNIGDSLHKTMTKITSSAEHVLTGAQQISKTAMDLANGATEQASSVQELNATISMITQQTMQNSRNAEEAKTLSAKSAENAQEGNIAMKQMLESMVKIKESSDSISRINRVIQDIAFQTNLLALNAAVEAARAGEHGKGFAVVAEEVRSLAARSQTASTDTTELVQDSIDRVETGSTTAQSTSEALDTIVSSAGEILEIIGSISASSKEQADAIEQVSIGIDQISTVVQSNSAVSEETAAAAEELNSQAELLRQLVSYFRLSS